MTPADRLADELKRRAGREVDPLEVRRDLERVRDRGARTRRVRLVAGSVVTAAVAVIGMTTVPGAIRALDDAKTTIAGKPSPAPAVALEFEGWTYRPPDGWSISLDTKALTILEQTSDPGGRVAFLKPDRVYDPATGKPGPVPDPPHGFITGHPDLRVDSFEASPVTVAGFAGSYYDATVARSPSVRQDVCARPCLPLFALRQPKQSLSVAAGGRTRFVIMNVDTTYVMVIAESSRRTFDDFIPSVEELLASMRPPRS